ncbi:MAG: ABC transporter ATP-binding protein [Planctomycetota bacterium]
MQATADAIIDLSDLAKTYKGKIKALRGVSMRVAPGEVFGLLGPNGAGKSTLVKIMMTVIRPSKGGGTMLGKPLGEKHALTDVGYLPEHHRFPGYLKGWQLLDFYGAMSGVPRKTRKARISELLDKVGMEKWGKTAIKRYSKGMRQRVGLAQALMGDPKLVFLDEPTDGVDPVGRREIRDICTQLKAEGRTVFLNSHLLSELEMICDRVAIMVQGQVKSQGTIEELTTDQRRYRIELAHDPEAALGHFEAVTTETIRHEISGSTLVLDTFEAEAMNPVLRALTERGAIVRTVTAHRPSLEDLFMQAVQDNETGKSLGPGAAEGGR